MKPDFTDIKQTLDRHLPDASPDEAKSAGVRVWQRLRTPAERTSELEARLNQAQPFATSAATRKTRWVQLAAAAVFILSAAVGTAMLWRSAADPMFSVVEGDVYQGETIRSNGGGGAVLALPDGSRVEMRSQSELTFERAEDGVLIRLSRGGIIVNAAKQRTGHLYVQTKDVTVSVVGTVFLVNADDDGSRVAVIEGEVRVQQGASETKLRPGEQVTTNPSKEGFPVASQLAWSRRAADLTTLLERQSAIQQQPAAAAPQLPKEPRVAFEVVTVRPGAPAGASAPGARGGGGGANSRPGPNGCVFDSMGYSLQLDRGRFAVNRTTLLHLAAYTMPVSALQGPGGRRPDHNCDVLTRVGLLSGGPDWIRSDMWDVVASIPEGTFSSTPALADPVLQQMLRTMLSERFGLALRRETREVPVYLLKVGKDGPKFNGPSPRATNRDPDRGPVMMLLGPDGKPRPAADLPPPPDGAISVIGRFLFGARNVTTTFWANYLFGLDGRPVLDRTGLTGRYDFHYEDPAGRPRGVGVRPDVAGLDRAVVKAMGFELEESKAPYDSWVIERAEKPTEN